MISLIFEFNKSKNPKESELIMKKLKQNYDDLILDYNIYGDGINIHLTEH
jgi:hypothetical protein